MDNLWRQLIEPGGIDLVQPPLVPKLHLGAELLVFEALLRQTGGRSPMRSRYRIFDNAFPHFVTGAIVGWLPIFTTSVRCDILVQAFQYCRAHKGLKLQAWVILDTHFHAVAAAPHLTRVLADLKRHTARRIVEKLQAERCDWLVDQLRKQCAPHKTESEHQVWQEGSHPQAIKTDAMILQKLEYLHNNPVKRGLVASPEHWRYSSAHEWLPGASVEMRCDRWR